MLTINHFLNNFEDPAFQSKLTSIYQDKGNQDTEKWAAAIYVSLRDDPTNEHYLALNSSRKFCLNLLYEMVNAWEASAEPDSFEQDIVSVFKVHRLKRILDVCLAMDRAQSLHKMQISTSRLVGMHWYSKLHLEPNSYYATKFPQEQQALKNWLAQDNYNGCATMNKRLFKLLYTESFGLLQDERLASWSRPARAIFVELATTSFQPPLKRDAPQKISPEQAQRKTIKSEPHNSMEAAVTKFVTRFDKPDFQEKLARLYQDKGSQDAEAWSKALYLDFHNDPLNARAKMLNLDRKHCLQLLYDMVDEWKKEYGLSPQYERAILHTFKSRRLLRILGVCLVMDRAQALYKMILPNEQVGMHWYSDLHFDNNMRSTLSAQEVDHWHELLKDYCGRATMNHRLYLLLYSDTLGLVQNDPLLAKWSHPEPAPR